MAVSEPRTMSATTALSLAARFQALAESQLFARLTVADGETLAHLSIERRIRRDEVVLRQGDQDANLLVVVEGRLRVGAGSVDGREIGHALMGPGSVIGEISLLDGGPRSADVMALSDGLCLVLERRVFLPFLTARPELMLQLMAILCQRLRHSSGAYEALAMAPLSARLARFLLELAGDRTPGPGGLVIPQRLSQRELGLQVAATRERVNKQLRFWQQAGILGGTSGNLVILDLAALQSAAQG